MRSITTGTRVVVCVAVSLLPSAAQRYSYQTLGFDDGLKNLAVEQILQDREGFLWVGTQNGLYRFDGRSFAEFGAREGVPLTFLQSLHESPDGTLWIGTQLGLWRRSGDKFEKMNIRPAQRVVGAHGIASDWRGRIYVATPAGLQIGERTGPGREWKFHFADLSAVDRRAASVMVSARGEVWLGCGNSICRLEGERAVEAAHWPTPPAEPWQALLEDRQGNIWARSKGALAVLRRGWTAFETVACERPLRSPWTPQLSMDLNGRILVPMIGGLGILEDGQWNFVTHSHGLPGNSVSVAYRDREGTIWLGMNGRGLARWIGYGEWESFTESENLENETIWQIVPDRRGNLWVATEDGLYQGRRNQGSLRFQRYPGIERTDIQALGLDSGGGLWAGLRGKGLERIDTAAHRVWQFPIRALAPDKMIHDIEVGPGDKIWFSCKSEPGLYSGTAATGFTEVAVPGAEKAEGWFVKALPDGQVWYGTTAGLFHYDGRAWSQFTQKDGLKDDQVWGLTIGPNGDLWIAYLGALGLTRAVPEAGRLRFTHFGPAEGLPSNQVYFSKFDAKGRMWVGTDRGVGVYDGKSWTHYGTADGLVWDDCDTDAFAAEPDGTTWIGTSAGLSRFRESPVRVAPEPPRVVFTSLSLGRRAFNPDQKPAVDHRANSLVAKFAVLAFSRPSSQNFRYRMIGLSTEWQETRQRELQFPELRPGAYRLEVDGYDALHGWSKQPAAFSFTILPPWWEDPWSRAMVFVVLVAWAWWYLRQSARKHHREKARLESAVQERTRLLRAEKDRSERQPVERRVPRQH